MIGVVFSIVNTVYYGLAAVRVIYHDSQRDYQLMIILQVKGDSTNEETILLTESADEDSNTEDDGLRHSKSMTYFK